MHQLRDLMSRDVKVISPDMTINEAAQAMRDGDFGMLPVGEKDRMIGAISDRDIAIRAVAEGKGPDTRVRKTCQNVFSGNTTTTLWRVQRSS